MASENKLRAIGCHEHDEPQAGVEWGGCRYYGNWLQREFENTERSVHGGI
jgi:hypothetical protein